MGSCKYYTEVTLGWMLNNKVIVVLSLLSFCLFVSTLAFAGQRRRLGYELEECRSSISTTVTTPAAETTEVVTTPTTPPPQSAAAVVKVLNAGQMGSPESQNKLLQLLAGAS